MLDKLQKRICWSFTAASLEPLAHCRNVASLNIFHMYYFHKYPFYLAQLVPLPYFRGRSTCYFNRLHDFSVILHNLIILCAFTYKISWLLPVLIGIYIQLILAKTVKSQMEEVQRRFRFVMVQSTLTLVTMNLKYILTKRDLSFLKSDEMRINFT